MKIVKIISLSLIPLMVGCANITIRPMLDYHEKPYYCTDKINKLISRGFEGNPIEQILTPILILDWPFDALTDTLLFPCDYISYSIRKNNWKNRQTK